MKISAVIVDDEFLDRELLTNLIKQYCNSISICSVAATVAEAISQINLHQPDVVFLDINMPEVGGFGLINYFTQRSFQVIFTTGSEEHGIHAVKAEAIDYLLKPIDVDELIASEQKLLKNKRSQRENPAQLRVFNGGEHILLNHKEIISIEAEGSYVKVYLSDGRKLIVSRNLKQVMIEIGDSTLKRVHRSFVVNTDHILRYQIVGNEINLYLTNEVIARASRKYKKVLKDVL